MSATIGYALDNHHLAAAEHHRALADLLDGHTTGRIHALRDPATMSRCLEVGSGGGTIAGWLAQRIDPDGEVIASDLNPDRIPDGPRLRTVAHDLAAATPLEQVYGTGYDLVVARLTLAHLPTRRTVLHRLAQLLAPGGVLLVEDWAALRDDIVIAAPTPQAADLYQRYQHAAADTFDASGADRGWARRIHPAMVEEGLADVETHIHGCYWQGGGPGTRLVAALINQLRPRLIAAGLTETDLTELAGMLDDPQLVIHGHPLYSTSGKRPG